MSGHSGKVILLTGGGRGIGHALADAFAADGGCVALCGRTGPEIAARARELALREGRAMLDVACDVRDAQAVEELVGRVLTAFGRIDVLVNAAGVPGRTAPLADLAPAEWEAVLQTNLTGAFLVTREVLRRAMLPAGAGCVLNVSSALGRRGRAELGAYAASKHGLEGLTASWALETAARGIRFYTVDPGPTDTAMRRTSHPDAPPAKPARAVAAAFLALARGESGFATGSCVVLDAHTGALPA